MYKLDYVEKFYSVNVQWQLPRGALYHYVKTEKLLTCVLHLVTVERKTPFKQEETWIRTRPQGAVPVYRDWLGSKEKRMEEAKNV